MQNIQSYQFFGKASEKLDKDKKRFETFKNEDDVKNLTIKSNTIQIKNLNFTYEKNLKDKLIFKNLSLTILPGEKLGFIGASGSGKSTLLDLIMGLLNPSSGEINIENLPLNKIKNSWQKKIGCVAQETFISDESLKKTLHLVLRKIK